MQAVRTTQPYRRGDRKGSDALAAMMRGAPSFLPNPMDVERAFQRGHPLLALLRPSSVKAPTIRR